MSSVTTHLCLPALAIDQQIPEGAAVSARFGPSPDTKLLELPFDPRHFVSGREWQKRCVRAEKRELGHSVRAASLDMYSGDRIIVSGTTFARQLPLRSTSREERTASSQTAQHLPSCSVAHFEHNLRTKMIERLPTSIPLTIDAVWRTRFWTTTPPIYVPHTEWTLSVEVSADYPLRLARVDNFARGSVVTKYQRRPSPYQPPGSTYGVSTLDPTETEPSADLLDSPWSALNLDPPKNPVTWTLIPVVRGANGAIRTSIIAFPRQDTEGLRTGHWRIRESLRDFLSVQSEAFNRGIYKAPVIVPWQQNGNV